VLAGVGGIAIGLEREESVADGDHPMVEPFGDLARQRRARRIVRCDERGKLGR
jgi:hypothetical protein